VGFFSLNVAITLFGFSDMHISQRLNGGLTAVLAYPEGYYSLLYYIVIIGMYNNNNYIIPNASYPGGTE